MDVPNLAEGVILREDIPVQQLHAAVIRINRAKGRFLKEAQKVSLHEVEDYFENRG